MRLVLLFSFFVLFGHQVSAQCKHQRLTIFEDYTSCLSGIKDNEDKVILEPEFEMIIFYGYDRKKSYYWVQKEGLQGVIDCDMNYVIPLDYTSIKQQSTPNIPLLYVVEQNGLFGVLNNEGKIKVPIQYESIKLQRLSDYQPIRPVPYVASYFWIAQKNGLSGLLDTAGTVIIPIKYQELKKHVNSNSMYNRSNGSPEWTNVPDEDFVDARLPTGEHGLFTRRGETLIPAEYLQITTKRYGDTTFIEAQKKGNETYLFNGEGTFLCKDSTRSHVNIEWLETSDKERIPYALFYNQLLGGRNKIVNLSSGKELLSKDVFIPMKGIFVQQDGSAVFDANLDTIVRLKGTHIEWRNEFLLENSNVYSFHTDRQNTVSGVFDSNGKQLFELSNAHIFVTGEGSNLLYWITTYTPMDSLTYHKEPLSLQIRDRKGEITQELPLEDGGYLGWIANQYQPHKTFRKTYFKLSEKTNSLAIIKSNGKWGALSAQGEIVVPFKYDKFIQSWSENGKVRGYYFEKDGKTGLVDINGEIRIPFNYKDFTPNIGSTNYSSFVANDGSFSLLKTNGEFVVRNAEYITTAIMSNQNLAWNKSTLEVSKNKRVEYSSQCFAVIDGFAYVIINDKHYKYDTINFEPNSQQPIINNLLVNKEGKVVEQSKKPFTLLNDLIVNSLENDGVRIFDIKTLQPILELDSVDAMQATFAGAIVRFTNTRMGLLHPTGSHWLVKPEFYWIKPIENTTKYWVKIAPTNVDFITKRDELNFKGDWIIIDSSGVNQFDGFTTMGPFERQSKYSGGTIFSDDSLAGLMGHDLSILVKPEYEQIHSITSSNMSLLFKNNKWQLFSIYAGKSEAFDAISQKPYGRIHMGRNGDKFSLFTVDSTYKYLVKDVPRETFMKYNFLRLSQIGSIRGAIPMDFTSVTDSAKSEPFWSLKNEERRWIFLVNMSPRVQHYPARHQWTIPAYFYKSYRYYSSKIYPQNASNQTDYFIHYTEYDAFDGHISMRSRYYNNLVYSRQTSESLPDGHGSNVIKSTHTSFVQTDEGIDSVALYDFLKDTPKTRNYIYSILEEQINERQIFGIACPNLPEIIAELEQAWYFNKTGINFEGEANRQYTITIDYTLLKKYVDKRYKPILKELINEAKEYEKKRDRI